MHPDIRQDYPDSCPICGMALEPLIVTADSGPSPELAVMTKRFWIGLLLAVPVFALEMGSHILPALHHLVPAKASIWIQFVLATPVVLWCGCSRALGARWRNASSEWANLARPAHLKLKASEKAQHLASLKTFILDGSALQGDQTAIERLGPNGHDPSFNFEGAIAVADWAKHVRSTLPEPFAGALMRCSGEFLVQLGTFSPMESRPRVSIPQKPEP